MHHRLAFARSSRLCLLGLLALATALGCTSESNQSPHSTNKMDDSAAEPAGSTDIATDWTQFRGPKFNSISDTPLPLEWDPAQDALWQQALPGRGASSPIVAGEQVLVTAYSGYGLSLESPGEPSELRHHLIALDRATGKPKWQREIAATGLVQKMNPELARHGFASSTPATDGEFVFAYFGVSGIFAFTLEGEFKWQRNLGVETNYFGSSASPVLHGDVVIVNASIESNTIYALDKKTGAAKWKIDQVNECWSMPVIGQDNDGNFEMVVSSKNDVSGYDPATGRKLWSCPGIQDYVVSVPVIHDGICYLTGGKQKQTMAIRLGELAKDVPRKLWEIPKFGSNVSSPVFKDELLFIFHDNATIQIIDAGTGNLANRVRSISKERHYATPLVAGNHLYMPFQDAGIGVYSADEKCELIATVPSKMSLMASLVPSGDRFFYRGDEAIVCVATNLSPDRQTGSAQRNPWMPPSDHDQITAREHYNIDPVKGWSRRYLGYLKPDFSETVKLLLIPYRSVITESQSAAATKIIEQERASFQRLRETLEQLQWDELTAAADEVDSFGPRWESLEAETNEVNRLLRIEIKKLFSEEQLAQHLRDAAARISHLPPGGK